MAKERAKIHQITCRECGVSFMAIRKDAQFCSSSHSSRYVQRNIKNSGRFRGKFSDEIIRSGIDLVNAGVTWAKAAETIGMSMCFFRQRVEKLGT